MFSPDFFGHAEKQNDKKITINFKLYDVMNQATNIYNIYCPILPNIAGSTNN